jgi:hypothetical protein
MAEAQTPNLLAISAIEIPSSRVKKYAISARALYRNLSEYNLCDHPIWSICTPKPKDDQDYFQRDLNNFCTLS